MEPRSPAPARPLLVTRAAPPPTAPRPYGLSSFPGEGPVSVVPWPSPEQCPLWPVGGGESLRAPFQNKGALHGEVSTELGVSGSREPGAEAGARHHLPGLAAHRLQAPGVQGAPPHSMSRSSHENLGVSPSLPPAWPCFRVMKMTDTRTSVDRSRVGRHPAASSASSEGPSPAGGGGPGSRSAPGSAPCHAPPTLSCCSLASGTEREAVPPAPVCHAIAPACLWRSPE